MARAMWKGAIQFGLVTIPVKLYLATESKGISFNMLHKDDLSRIQMKVWCPVEDEVDLALGHGQGLRVRARRVRRRHRRGPRAGPAQDGPLDRDRAVHQGRARRLNVRFVKSAYYIEPDKVGRKAFYLLKAGPRGRGLTAICKVVIKDREALAAIDPFGDTMLLTTLHWPDEIRSTGELDLPEEEYDFKPAEIAMAKQLVAAMTGEFRPERVQGRVPRGAREGHRGQGRGPRDGRGRGARGPEGKLVDLMAALEASVNAATASRKEPVSVSEAKAARRSVRTKAEKAKPAAPRAPRRRRATRTRRPPASGSRRKRKSADGVRW